MAKHHVKSFNVAIDSSSKFVDVEIETALQKPYKIKITPDVNHPNVEHIRDELNRALTHCVTNLEKVEVSLFPSRFYASINVKDYINTRFSTYKAK